MENPPENKPYPLLSERFLEAFSYAARLHARQTRKGTSIPYIAHLLGVTALVLEDGGSEDEAIAALLHDAVEDQGGRTILEEIRGRFGEEVAVIVAGLTDAYETPKPPWQERKEGYLQHLQHAPPAIMRVSLADKVHNARSLLASLEEEGPQIWQRFRGGLDGTLWYYRSLAEIFQKKAPGYLSAELLRLVEALENHKSHE
jgi:(p)ppGpp synthase/HD superfamily hydrolase